MTSSWERYIQLHRRSPQTRRSNERIDLVLSAVDLPTSPPPTTTIPTPTTTPPTTQRTTTKKTTPMGPSTASLPTTAAASTTTVRPTTSGCKPASAINITAVLAIVTSLLRNF
ncbi:hypothetical protein PENTCL1PPCAC_3839 [Pristionchus entomophagus]|uniref:Uncharacterized protein n=1 Tax=Pristionchus entomophagus TaxID=358040 RepID=A0AAV5SFN3_9BILA|nr:hypothetical protein PENTCL1PPCAC_3839 [Pristionchus entomophagus]